jgi:Na+/H+ antiporter NhaD/arsenite permease-like protein
MAPPAALPAILIFAATYFVLALGRLPGFRVDRTGAAIIGAALMVAVNALTLPEAVAAINTDTILLLFGMMIVVANLRLSGIFALITEWVVEHAHRPLVLLAAIVGIAGVFSAFFVNDTMCLVLTPLVLEITTQLRRNPIPYLLALAMASNIGSVATVTGNPQNMLIGSFSGIHYRAFAAALAPVALLGLAVVVATIAVAYRTEFFAATPRVVIRATPVCIDRPLTWKSAIASACMIVLFFAGWPISKVALVTGALLLITRRVKPERVYNEIDWSLIVLFIGLFIVVRGVEKTSLSTDLLGIALRLHLERTGVMSAFAAVLSNIVSNVPAVLVFRPFIPHLADPRRAWLTLAMSSTLAGNLTVLGSVANLIVLQRARHQVRITFSEYMRVGAPLTLVTIIIGVLWLG